MLARAFLTTAYLERDQVAPLARHTSRDTSGNPVTTREDAFKPGGRHSRDLMNTPTERLAPFTQAMTFFDDDATTATEADTDP